MNVGRTVVITPGQMNREIYTNEKNENNILTSIRTLRGESKKYIIYSMWFITIYKMQQSSTIRAL